ncbi:hypothetical protein EON67_12485 [archaeon]|nr:MAG: hypothetical protein EON67_12485 [archaeon]
MGAVTQVSSAMPSSTDVIVARIKATYDAPPVARFSAAVGQPLSANEYVHPRACACGTLELTAPS